MNTKLLKRQMKRLLCNILKLVAVLVLGVLCLAAYFYQFKAPSISIQFRYKTDPSVKTNPTERPTTTPVKEWSSEWPIVNLINCSHREYMNRGVNSPDNVEHRYFPRTGLVSAPGSGNTWTRFMIEQATGLWTGSVFDDKSLYNGGLKGEFEKCSKNSTIVIKAHYTFQDEKHKCPFERIILVVRNIHRATLSEFNRQSSKSHVGLVKEDFLNSEKWTAFVKKSSFEYANINIMWIKAFLDKEGTKVKLKEDENPFTIPASYWKSLLMVSYERLKQSPIAELQRIVDFLGVPVFRKECLKENSNGKFHRKKSKTAEEMACLFDHPESRLKMEQNLKFLKNSSKNIGSGNITAEFEAIEKIDTTNKCTPNKTKENSS